MKIFKDAIDVSLILQHNSLAQLRLYSKTIFYKNCPPPPICAASLEPNRSQINVSIVHTCVSASFPTAVQRDESALYLRQQAVQTGGMPLHGRGGGQERNGITGRDGSCSQEDRGCSDGLGGVAPGN